MITAPQLAQHVGTLSLGRPWRIPWTTMNDLGGAWFVNTATHNISLWGELRRGPQQASAALFRLLQLDSPQVVALVTDDDRGLWARELAADPGSEHFRGYFSRGSVAAARGAAGVLVLGPGLTDPATMWLGDARLVRLAANATHDEEAVRRFLQLRVVLAERRRGGVGRPCLAPEEVPDREWFGRMSATDFVNGMTASSVAVVAHALRGLMPGNSGRRALKRLRLLAHDGCTKALFHHMRGLQTHVSGRRSAPRGGSPGEPAPWSDCLEFAAAMDAELLLAWILSGPRPEGVEHVHAVVDHRRVPRVAAILSRYYVGTGARAASFGLPVVCSGR